MDDYSRQTKPIKQDFWINTFKAHPKVKIGCRYEPHQFVHRGRDGSYSAKMPEMSGDALLIQAALLQE